MGLLERNAQDTKTEAGQYFTPREALRGVEIVHSVTRLYAMNLLLHNVGPTAQELARLREELVAAGQTPEQADAEVERASPVKSGSCLAKSWWARDRRVKR